MASRPFGLPTRSLPLLVDTQAPQGIAALVEPPHWELASVLASDKSVTPGSKAHAPLILIAAGLQDPGNLGTLIRSAEAVAATAVLTTPGNVSAWNQKALRASAGSVFRVPVVAVTHADLAALKSRDIRLLAAVAPDAKDRSRPHSPISPSPAR